MLVSMATNTLIRMFWDLRGVLQDIYGWNVLTTSIYVRNNGLRLFYKGLFETNSKFRIFGAERTKQLKWFFL